MQNQSIKYKRWISFLQEFSKWASSRKKGAKRNRWRYEKTTFEIDANFRAEFVQNMCARY